MNKLPLNTEETALILNRGFKYGDALFETIRVMNGRALFVDDHFNRLTDGLQLLQMEWSVENNVVWLKQMLSEYICVHNLLHARIRITVFRDGAGLYTPVQNNVRWVIDSSVIPWVDYSFTEQGQKYCLYRNLYKPSYFLSRIKTTNSLVFVMAGLFMKQQGADNCFILNEQGRVAEAMSSNVFIIKNNHVFTPSISEGALPGIMRKKVIEVLKKQNYIVVETSITLNDLSAADEIFCTNVISGIQWCSEFESIKYVNTFTRSIAEAFNRFIAP